MKKIVAFIGGPRKNGFSTQVLNKVIEGAKEAGAEIVTYDLNSPDVRPCQSCFYCRKFDGCSVQDALQPMYKDIDEAVGIIVSIPIYFYSPTAQAKALIDRLFPMLDSKFRPRHPGKKVVTIYAQGNGDAELYKNSIDTTNGIFESFGWKISKSILVSGTTFMKELDENIVAEAIEAGKNLI